MRPPLEWPAESTADTLADRLRQSGWIVTEVHDTAGWRVTATRGGTLVEMTDPTRPDAWRRVCDQAAAAGTL